MAATSKARSLPFRFKNRYGKEFGSYYIRIGKNEICLRTKDPEEANARARRARAGARDFSADSDAKIAATAVAEALTGTGDAKTPPVVEPPAAPAPSLPPPAPPSAPMPAPAALPSVNTPPAALPPIPPPPSSPPHLSVVPDAILPPPPGWADGVRAAAAEAQANGASSGPNGGAADPEETITPDMLEDILDQAAETVVALQLYAQAWLAAHAKPVLGINIKVATVPETAKGRAVGKKIWKRCFGKLVQKYMPNLDIPEWIAAPVLVAALTLPVQFGEGAEELKSEPKKTETAPSAPGASAAAA